jgi:hypothetical protein
LRTPLGAELDGKAIGKHTRIKDRRSDVVCSICAFRLLNRVVCSRIALYPRTMLMVMCIYNANCIKTPLLCYKKKRMPAQQNYAEPQRTTDFGRSISGERSSCPGIERHTKTVQGGPKMAPTG